MKLIKTFFSYMMILVVLSCNSENDIIKADDIGTNHLVFENEFEYEKELELVMRMSNQERTVWEKEKNFKSFGLEAERFYFSIDPYSFPTTNDVIKYANDNKQYLQIIEDEDGELELEARFGKKKNRYLMNIDQMYQIRDSIYKVFDKGIIIAHSNDIQLLYEIGDDFEVNNNINQFTFKPNAILNNLKSITQDCGTAATWRSTINNERLKADIEVSGNGSFKVRCEFVVRPYNKILGIWYWCYRNISADINLNYKYFDQISVGTYGWVASSLNYYSNFVYS